MKRVCILSIIMLLIALVNYSYAQPPTIPIPQIGLPNTQPPRIPTPTTNPNITIGNTIFNQKAQNEAQMREVQQHQRQLKEAEKQKIYIQDQRRTDAMMLTKYGFGSQSDGEGTAAFYSAFEEINNMLNGNQV